MSPSRFLGATAALVAVVLASAACSPAENAGLAEDNVLDLAFTSDMNPPDPDANYQLQGNTVMLALYEGLLEYSPEGTTEIVGRLADSWEVSDDALTYTFTLRENLTFADGTPLDSTALLRGFERRADESVGSPMSYMLLPVAGYETPDPRTFVITLSQPESAFLSYLASPFSPKAINPKTLDEHAGDHAAEYLKTASAGSGPYVLSTFERGSRYVLTRNENYWGEKPEFDEVDIAITPDPATQVLAFQSGDLDVLMGQPISTIDTFADDTSTELLDFPALQKTWVELNTFSTPLTDPAVRASMRSAIDRKALVDQVWADHGDESEQMYPASMLPADLAADTWSPTPPAPGSVPTERIQIAYIAGTTLEQQVAETLQSQLEQAGFTTELVSKQESDMYAYTEDPAAGPDLFVQSSFPDSTHPDTWARLFWYHDVASGAGGFLNYFGTGSAASDELINAGLAATDDAAANQNYAEVGNMAHSAVEWITLNDTRDLFLVKSGLTGFGHWIAAPGSLDVAQVRSA
jgi:peptide/nickel transport system substrate-binding protein